jgi:hypothetical protein
MPIKNVLLGTIPARRAYAAVDQPSSPWFFTAVNMIHNAERSGLDPWEAAREMLLRMNHELAVLVDREVLRQMREPTNGQRPPGTPERV